MRIHVAALSAVIAINAHAAPTDSQINVCAVQSDLAGAIMERRQDGTAMRDVMVSGLRNNDDSGVSKIFTILTQWAYKEPRHSYPPDQWRAVADFKDMVMSVCLDNIPPPKQAKTYGPADGLLRGPNDDYYQQGFDRAAKARK